MKKLFTIILLFAFAIAGLATYLAQSNGWVVGSIVSIVGGILVGCVVVLWLVRKLFEC